MADWKQIHPYIFSCPKKIVEGLGKPPNLSLYKQAESLILKEILEPEFFKMLKKCKKGGNIIPYEHIHIITKQFSVVTKSMKKLDDATLKFLLRHMQESVLNFSKYLSPPIKVFNKKIVAVDKHIKDYHNLSGYVDFIVDTNLGLNLVWINTLTSYPNPSDIFKYYTMMQVAGRAIELKYEETPTRLTQFYVCNNAFMHLSYDGVGLEYLGKLADTNKGFARPSEERCKDCPGCNFELFLNTTET